MRSRLHLICALLLLVACLRMPTFCRALQSQSESVANPAQPSKPGSAMTAPSAKNSAPAASPDFVIGPSDVLNVNVWREAEISRSVPVRPDGKISLPLLGDLQASGLTADQLQNVIKKGLKDYISNPEVTVIVQEVKSRQVNVVGQVAKPGSYVLAKNMTVLDAIATAGGFKDFAKTQKIYVLRITQAGHRIRLPFNYKEVIKGR